MKMMVGLMVVAAATVFALMIPASSAVVLELEDVITRDAYENLVERGAMNGIAMTKTVISNPILEEALVSYSKNKLGGGTIFNCGETCLMGTCYTPGCLCDTTWRVCYKNSLQAVQQEALLPNFARKVLAGFAN